MLEFMTELGEIAPAFVEMAHRIVWCSVATVDSTNRPRTRVLHPLWEWDGEQLVGWVATSQTPVKTRDLNNSPYVSCSYWDPTHDTCQVEASTSWHLDDETRTRIWNLFVDAPAPVGYDPSIIPQWTSPIEEPFAVLRLDPVRLRLMEGSLMATGQGRLLTWQA